MDLLSRVKRKIYKTSYRIMRKKRKQKRKGVQLKLSRYIIIKLDKITLLKICEVLILRRDHTCFFQKVLMMTLF